VSTQYSTSWSTSKLRKPLRQISLWCANTSCPPPCGRARPRCGRGVSGAASKQRRVQSWRCEREQKSA
jgi:hypothetical protein